ncbi:MAG: nucleotide sugar dehydrogenase [Actinomycetes bacterium]
MPARSTARRARMPRPLVRRLVERLEDRTATVAVIGQGYVGLSVAAGAATVGMRVHGVDADPDRIAGLTAGRNVVPGVSDEVVALAIETGRLTFGTDPAVVTEADVVLVCVPTPVHEHRPDLRWIESAGRDIAPHLHPGALVILESTTYPGTTEQVLQPLLEAGGLRAGRDFLLGYSPERIDPGNPKYGLANTPRVVGGLDTDSTRASAAFYAQVVEEVMPLSSLRAAEMAKLLENTFRMVNIALVNELAMLCAEQGIDTWEVIDAAATKPFGFMPFSPGPGVGGHCIPLDPTYLAWQSRRDTGKPFRMVEMAQDINAGMPEYVTRRVIDALGRHGLAITGARLLVLGVTYKPNVGDVRESAAIEVIAQLARRGAKVSYHDPYVPRIDEHGVTLTRKALTPRAIAEADAVLLLTPHDSYDVDALADQARLLFDARGAARHRAGPTVEVL